MWYCADFMMVKEATTPRVDFKLLSRKWNNSYTIDKDTAAKQWMLRNVWMTATIVCWYFIRVTAEEKLRMIRLMVPGLLCQTRSCGLHMSLSGIASITLLMAAQTKIAKNHGGKRVGGHNTTHFSDDVFNPGLSRSWFCLYLSHYLMNVHWHIS